MYIAELIWEGEKIMKTKPKLGNSKDIPDKDRYNLWRDNCVTFLKSNNYIEESIILFEASAQRFGINKMLGILKSFMKHRDELAKSSIVIKSFGYEPNYEMCSDKPDIVLPSKSNRQIGIEVTQYLHKSIAEHFYTHLTEAWVSVGNRLDEALLLKLIEDKEGKLKEYKKDPCNQSIKEYILLIDISYLDSFNIYQVGMPIGYNTQYNRIYLVEDNRFSRIK